MHDAQLQQHVQRQAAQFCERVMQAMAPLEASPRREMSDAALNGCLLYVSSAIDIATGANPEVNLMDLLVFLRLCREALESHWIPDLYREDGRDLVAAFYKSEEGLMEVAAMVLDESQRRDLEILVDGWITDNPGQFRVEGVRLDDFGHLSGQIARERAERAKGLLSTVKSATQSADQALLLAERGMFLMNRMPFLLRLQTRLALREVVSDLVARLLAVPRALGTLTARALANLLARGRAPLRAGSPPRQP